MLALTGRQADGWLPTQMPPEEYAEKLAVVRESAEAADRDPDSVTPSMLAYVLAAPDEETLERMYADPLVRLLFPAGRCPTPSTRRRESRRRSRAAPASTTTCRRRSPARRPSWWMHIPPDVARRTTLHGDAGQIADQIRALQQAGLRDVVLWNITAFADPSLAGYSFKVLREVKAILRGAPAPA